MYLLVIIVNDSLNLNKILKKFLEIDVRGATIINSTGMGSILSQDVPVFSALRKFLSGIEDRVENNTIFSVIKTENTLKNAIEEIKKIVDFAQPGSGIMFCMPIIEFYGLAEAISDKETNNAGK
jgi:nitrogen regulatory protein PII